MHYFISEDVELLANKKWSSLIQRKVQLNHTEADTIWKCRVGFDILEMVILL